LLTRIGARGSRRPVIQLTPNISEIYDKMNEKTRVLHFEGFTPESGKRKEGAVQ
jgi:hypothetical protein